MLMWLINYYGIMILLHLMFFMGLFAGLLTNKLKINFNFVVGILILSILWPIWWYWWIFCCKKEKEEGGLNE